ncbi:MAG: virulence RhuM family protein [Ignavibacteriales bacterium]|nr:MAG: virulence RhuM family protein [Ignavibacteriales bacterium]
MKNEIVIYQADELADKIEVRVENENVWLNRQQIASLFDRDIKTIGKHINNAMKEELGGLSVVAKFATTAADGKVYQIEHYNLDMIISVGYRVKSKRGVEFRIWANITLKDYMMNGYVLNKRINRIEDNVEGLTKKVETIDLIIKTELPPKQGIFFDGQIFDAHRFISDLVRKAEKSIVLIDNYVDDTVLGLFTKRKKNVKVTIYTGNLSKAFMTDLKKFNEQYPRIEVKEFKHSHDRFIIIDDEDVYHFGASLKDLGKKWFAFSKFEKKALELLNKLNKV